MKCKKIGNVLTVIIWLAQACAEIFTAYQIIKLNILPDKTMFLVELIFLFLLAGTGLLFFRHSKNKPGRLRLIITGMLSLLIVAVCMISSYTLFKLESTFSAVTAEKTLVTVPVGVYIKSDDSAETVNDSSNFTYAVIKSDTDSYADQAVEDIEKEIGDSISTKTYDSLPEMADALENDEVQAIIVNNALVDVLSEVEEYKDFPSGVKQIYEDSVVRKEESALNNTDSDTLRDNSDAKGVSAEENDTKAADVEKKIGTDITNTPFACYFSGSDTRDKMLTTSRSDVNILAVVNPNSKQILLVNTPRDYYIANPAGGGKLDKLTHCGIYGIDCSIQALADFYQVDIPYYAQINFSGFETLIDAVGGVSVYSEKAFKAINSEIHIGYNHLNGEEALDFARERHSLAGGDNDRGKNQMKVLQGLVNKFSAGTILKNYSDILNSLEGMFITNINSSDIAKLVKMQLTDMSKWNVNSYAVTGTGGRGETYSMPGWSLYVMYPDEDSVDTAKNLINQVIVGEMQEK